eukprot:COSAG06_NODE_1233_length_10152_cov_11.443251_13_plen_58_part_00
MAEVAARTGIDITPDAASSSSSSSGGSSGEVVGGVDGAKSWRQGLGADASFLRHFRG